MVLVEGVETDGSASVHGTGRGEGTVKDRKSSKKNKN